MNKPLTAASLLAVAGMLLMGALPVFPTSYTLQSDASSMHVEGTSTLHDWSCPVGAMEGSFQIDTSSTASAPISGIRRAHMSVPVEQIDCDNGTMNDKLREALQVNAYPTVIYTLESAELQPLPDSTARWFKMQTTGELIVAGARNQIDMTVKGQRLGDGRLRFVGQKALKLSAFDVERPSAMLGAIKTGDEVTVHFDVAAAP
jgi:hypothetical protein